MQREKAEQITSRALGSFKDKRRLLGESEWAAAASSARPLQQSLWEHNGEAREEAQRVLPHPIPHTHTHTCPPTLAEPAAPLMTRLAEFIIKAAVNLVSTSEV